MGLLQELAGDLSYGIQAHRRRLEQARAEQALLESAMEFRTLFDNTNDAILITDLKGRTWRPTRSPVSGWATAWMSWCR